MVSELVHFLDFFELSGLLRFTGFYRVLSRFLWNITGFDRVLPYLEPISLTINGFHSVLLCFTGFYWVLPGFIVCLTWFH